MPILTVSGAFTLLMISGYIDLSVGSAMSLNAVVFSWMILNGFSFLPAFIITMILGCIMGFLNGYLVMKLRITPVIATLVTLSLFKGIALLIVPDGLSAIKGSADKVMPGWINDYARKEYSFRAACSLLVRGLYHHRTDYHPAKDDPWQSMPPPLEETDLQRNSSGINPVKIVWLLYIMVGFFAALAGMARASYMSLGDPLSGDGMELSCIIAVLLGGTAFSGGEGSVAKTMIGAIIIVCVTTGLMTVIPAYWQMVATGSVLLIAVVINYQLARDKGKA